MAWGGLMRSLEAPRGTGRVFNWESGGTPVSEWGLTGTRGVEEGLTERPEAPHGQEGI